MVEGEKTFDITVRWPKRLRDSETSLLDLPIDVTNNKVDVGEPIQAAPRVRVRDLVSPVGKDGQPDPRGEFLRPAAVTIYREQRTRMMPVRFTVRGRAPADVRAEVAKKLEALLKSGLTDSNGGTPAGPNSVGTRSLVNLPPTLRIPEIGIGEEGLTRKVIQGPQLRRAASSVKCQAIRSPAPDSPSRGSAQPPAQPGQPRYKSAGTGLTLRHGASSS